MNRGKFIFIAFLVISALSIVLSIYTHFAFPFLFLFFPPLFFMGGNKEKNNYSKSYVRNQSNNLRPNYCPNCGNAIFRQWNFCPNCSYDLSHDSINLNDFR